MLKNLFVLSKSIVWYKIFKKLGGFEIHSMRLHFASFKSSSGSLFFKYGDEIELCWAFYFVQYSFGSTISSDNVCFQMFELVQIY